jgi:hypothetical protein
MKTNKFLLTITLCAGLQFNAHAAEQAETPTTEQSYWQMYAPQFAQDAATTTSAYVASWIPQPVKDRVNSWSPRKQKIVLGAIITSLAAIYNREAILEFVNNMLITTPSTLWSEFHTTLEQFDHPTSKSVEESARAIADAIRHDFAEHPDETLQSLRESLNNYKNGKIQMNSDSAKAMRAIYIFFSENI